jgi:hypothetical protein
MCYLCRGANAICTSRIGIKAHEGVRLPDDRANITAFVAITKGAGERQIMDLCWATMLFTDDMIDLTTEERVIFMNQAILTEALSAINH